MSGRRQRADDSSLELLLDTITNTFGGILFIAILLSLLLKSSSRAAREATNQVKPMSAVEQAELESHVADLQQEVESLRQRVTAAASEPGDAQAEDNELSKLSAAAAAVEEAVLERAKAVRNTLEYQREAAAATKQFEMLEQDRKMIESRLAEAEHRLAGAREEAARLAEAALQIDRPQVPTEIQQTVSLPSLRPSLKTEVGLYVRFDKIFMMHSWRNGERQGPNTEQFVIVPTPDGNGVRQIARPKPDTGMEVNADTVTNDLRRMLQPFPPNRFVVSVVVFEDSFDVFQLIKASIVRNGYEYRPIPLSPGQSIVDSGGRGEAQ
jgi:hypothetical protein